MTVLPGLLAAALAASGAAAPSRGFEVQSIADGVYAVVRTDPPGLMCDGNGVLIVNDDDVVVVDAPEHTREVIAALRAITTKPVRYVINTHAHDDHITGNELYKEAYPGVEFIGQSRLREYLPGAGAANRASMIASAPQGVAMLKDLLATNKSLGGGEITEEERESYLSDIGLVEHYLDVVPRSKFVLPTIAVESRLTLHRGGRVIDILHLGGGHTGSDLVVHLPNEKIVIAGDLVVAPVPLVGSDQSHVREWGPTLDRLVALAPATIVPGHGPVLRDDAYPRLLSRLFASVTRQTEAAVARGETLDQVRKSVSLDEFRTAIAGDSSLRRVLFDVYVAGPAVGAAFREAGGKP